MKQTALLFLIVFVQISWAQDRISYLDKDFRPMQKGTHIYYRVLHDSGKPSGPYAVETFYLNKSRREKATVIDTVSMAYDGPRTTFYGNTQMRSYETFRSGKPLGMYKTWYPNGKPMIAGSYIGIENSQETVLSIDSFWDSKNVMLIAGGYGDYDLDYEGLHEKGRVEKGLRQGKWTGKRASVSFEEEYENGVLKSGKLTDASGKTFSYTQLSQAPESRWR